MYLFVSDYRYLLQTPLEDSPAAAVFVCAASQWKNLKVHRWGVAVLKPQGHDPAGSDPGEDPVLSLRLGTSTPWVSLLSLPPEGDVRRPDPREDEGRQPGWGESEQYMCAELQGPLVEQDLVNRRPGDWWTISLEHGWTLILLCYRLRGTWGRK